MQHNGEKRNGARYTAARRPVRLVYQAAFRDPLGRPDRGSAHQAADARREAAADRQRDRRAGVSETFDAIVIGAGAAGLMCALTAGQRGRKVLLLEHLDKAGAKILISGGGRCNFTNLLCAPERFLSANPHFHKSALAATRSTTSSRWSSAMASPITRRRSASCSATARRAPIVAMLLAECARGGVDVRLGHRVTDISRAERFRVETDKGGFTARGRWCWRPAGCRSRKWARPASAYELARRFGLRVTETLPGLVPLTATPAGARLRRKYSRGVSLDAVASCGAQSFRENILFTHRGLSGPAILQISSYWRAGRAIALDLLPELDAERLPQGAQARAPEGRAEDRARRSLSRAPGAGAAPHALPHGDDGQHPRPHAQRLRRTPEALARSRPTGSEGYAKAEVTVGGIDTRDLSSKTMAGAQRARPLRHRRSGRRHRLARRL